MYLLIVCCNLGTVTARSELYTSKLQGYFYYAGDNSLSISLLRKEYLLTSRPFHRPSVSIWARVGVLSNH